MTFSLILIVIVCDVMEILDLSNVGSDVPSYVRNKMESGLDQPLTQILLNPNANYSWYLVKGELRRYNIAYNEYEGGLYLGSKDNPYLCLIQPKDDKVTTLIVHPDCRLVCQFAFHQHPNLTDLSIAAEDELNIAHDAFSQCPKLQSISFNCKGHVFLRYSVFQNCPNLENVTFDEMAQYEFSGHLFASCPKLTRFEFPKGIAQDYVQNRAYDVFHLIVKPELFDQRAARHSHDQAEDHVCNRDFPAEYARQEHDAAQIHHRRGDQEREGHAQR